MALMIFSKLGMMVSIDARKKVTKLDYPKNFGSFKKSINVVKMTVFRLFLQKWMSVISPSTAIYRAAELFYKF